VYISKQNICGAPALIWKSQDPKKGYVLTLLFIVKEEVIVGTTTMRRSLLLALGLCRKDEFIMLYPLSYFSRKIERRSEKLPGFELFGKSSRQCSVKHRTGNWPDTSSRTRQLLLSCLFES